MTRKTTTLRTLYVHVDLNGVICPQILYDIVLYARHFLPVKFSPKCYFTKVCFDPYESRILARYYVFNPLTPKWPYMAS